MGLPYELAARLSGETEEDIRKDAVALSKVIGQQEAPLASTERGVPKDNNTRVALKGVLDGLKGGVNGEYPKYLKENGKVEIKSFFDRLGKSDLDSQLRLIDEHKRKIDFVYETAKNDKKKKGELGYKLSLMAGIALLIILA